MDTDTPCPEDLSDLQEQSPDTQVEELFSIIQEVAQGLMVDLGEIKDRLMILKHCLVQHSPRKPRTADVPLREVYDDA